MTGQNKQSRTPLPPSAEGSRDTSHDASFGTDPDIVRATPAQSSRDAREIYSAASGNMIGNESLAGGLIPSARIPAEDGRDPIDEKYKQRLGSLPSLRLENDDGFATEVNEKLETYRQEQEDAATATGSDAQSGGGADGKRHVNFRRGSTTSRKTTTASSQNTLSAEEKAKQEADNLIEHHLKWGMNKPKEDPTEEEEGQHFSRADQLETGVQVPEFQDGDVEDDYLNNKGTSGILSSLLKLYNGKPGPAAGPATASTTAVHTPRTSASNTPLLTPVHSPGGEGGGTPKLKPHTSPGNFLSPHLNIKNLEKNAKKLMERPTFYRSSSEHSFERRAKVHKGLGHLALTSLNTVAGAGQEALENDKRARERKAMKKKYEARQRQIAIHIADILQRQRFLLRFARALMLYGAPSHRLEEFLYQTAAIFEVDAAFMYFPGCCVVTFGDSTTHTSESNIIRVAQGLNLHKLHEAFLIYKDVVHGHKNLEQASTRLDELLGGKNPYPKWLLILFFALGSAFIGMFAFGGGWKELPIIFGLSLIVGFLQMWAAPRSALYSNVFEISSCILVSFLGRAISSITRNGNHVFCFGAIVQGSIAMILPGYIILTGALEMQAKSLVSGSVRMFYAIIYSMFLTFGITLGSAIYGWMDHNASSDLTCTGLADPKWKILFVPLSALCLALCNQAAPRQLPVMVIVACAGYTVLALLQYNVSNTSIFTSTIGALTIGIFGNLWSRLGHGLAFTTMVPGVLVIVPGGVAAQGALISGVNLANSIVSKAGTGSSTDTTDVSTFGGSMTQVAVGISVGLFMSTLAVYPLGMKSKTTALFSF